MEFILSLVIKSMGQVWLSIQHNWLYLALSVVIATLLKLYINAEKVSDLLNRFRRAGIIVATAAAVATPLCSCGTIAVILGMLASRMPWAPIVAFMVASPLSSPEGLVYRCWSVWLAICTGVLPGIHSTGIGWRRGGGRA